MQQPAYPGMAPPQPHHPPPGGPIGPGMPGMPGMHMNPAAMNMNMMNAAAMMRPGVMQVPGITEQEKTLNHQVDLCMDHIRLLRMEIEKFLRFFWKGIPSGEGEQTVKFAEHVIASVRHIGSQYDALEVKAAALPSNTPHSHVYDTMNRVAQESSTDIQTAEFFESLMAVGMNKETYTQTYHFMYEFLRMSNSRPPKSSFFPERTMNHCQADKHRNFIHMFKLAAQDARKRGWNVRQTENCPILTVFELNFYGSFDIASVDLKTRPVLLKMALLVNSGQFEFIQFIAPREDWTYVGSYKYRDEQGNVIRGKQIDPFYGSRFLVYQRMAVTGNIQIIHSFNGQFAVEPKPITFNKMLVTFTNFNDVFTSKCRICNKILKNFMPPLPLMHGMKGFCHETCTP
ncbi:hypothetical protein QR680_019096 [Steinernema hermaphroditum]|uniref:Uncharacterized protein n=1 Tax=Steinernema hermaphroditum TaxID=289476 RepID=A0AA39LRT7_9BILA|nr:hypothetical protein QR680_019096 [Steinernema hermaphroditum]